MHQCAHIQRVSLCKQFTLLDFFEKSIDGRSKQDTSDLILRGGSKRPAHTFKGLLGVEFVDMQEPDRTLT